MQFSNLYKSPRSPLSRLRHQTSPQPLQPPSGDWDPDLFSRDKEKQKNAVRRYLDDKVRTDWDFQWPQTPEPAPTVPAAAVEEVTEAPVDAAAGGPEIAEKNQEDGDMPGSGLADAQREEPTKDTDTPPAQDTYAAGSTMRAAEHIPTPKTTTIVSSADPASQPSPDVPPEVGNAESRDPGYEADSGSDAESEYSTVSEDPARFRRRIEWESGEETEDDEYNYASLPLRIRSPYRFDNPDSVGADLFARTLEEKAKKRRALRKEMKWNDGLACFQARRDAWTGAKTVRLKPTIPPETSREEKPLSPLSPRRLFMRAGLSSPSSPVAGAGAVAPLSLAAGSPSSGDSAEGEAVFSMRETNSKDTNASSTDENDTAAAAATAADDGAKKADRLRYPVVTLLPNPAPLLPSGNPMRASITPSAYNSIFEKIVLQGMTPSCPVNLSDMVNACVSGWKKRGEWPPRMTAPEPNFARRKAAMNAAGKQGQAVGGLKIVQVGPRSAGAQPVGREVSATRDDSAARRKSSVALPDDASKSAPAQPPPSSHIAPRAPSPPPHSKNESRRKSFSFLTRERSKDERKEDDASGTSKVFRRSLQRVLGWHPHHVRGGSFDGPASPPPMTLSGRTDPAPAVVNPEHARGRLSQDGRRSGKDSLDRKLSGDARNCGGQHASAGKIKPVATATVGEC